MDLRDERSHYEVLGVAPNATPQQLRDAHRQMALVLHPDRHAQSPPAERRLAERRMSEVNVAWSVLSDPGSRVAYDRTLRARTTAPRSPAGGGADRGSAGGRGTQARRPGTNGSSGSDGTDGDARWDTASGRDASSARGGGSQDGEAAFDLGEMFESGDEFDPDDEPVPEWQYWMFKRGPVIAIFLVAAVLFVATAYAGSAGRGGSDADSGGGPTSTLEADNECVSIATAGRSATRVPCSGPNDGRIVTKVSAALDCPAATTYVLIHQEFLCVTTDPSVVGSKPGG
ncbi:MAG: J domain-containing protein [Microthrixaceae bacterium]